MSPQLQTHLQDLPTTPRGHAYVPRQKGILLKSTTYTLYILMVQRQTKINQFRNQVLFKLSSFLERQIPLCATIQ